MPWRPLPRIAFAVATYPFQPSSPADLPLELGDELYIIEQGGTEGSWYRGYLVAPPSLLAGLTSVKGQTLEARVFSGIFPKCCVEVREVLRDTRADGQACASRLDHDHGSLDSHCDVSRYEIIKSSPKNSVRRSGGKSGYVGTGESIPKGGTPQMVRESTPSRSTSNRIPEKVNGQVLARKLSHQSITSPGSRDSALTLIPAPANFRGPGEKRSPAPVPMLKIGDETPTSTSEPLVDEIASCLREWHSKNLHELLLSRRYSVLEEVSELVYQLDLSRRQLLHDVLTAQELDVLREKAVWDLVRGNKMLSGEVIVRDPKQHGRLLTGSDSAIELTKLQSTMSLLVKSPTVQQEIINLHHLMVELKACTNNDLNMPTLTGYLCSHSPGELPKPLTETFSFDIPTQNQLGKAVGLGKLQTLFTNLTSTDIGETSGSEAQVYLVIDVYTDQLTQSPLQTAAQSPNPKSPSSLPGKPTTSSLSGITGVKGGRRSMMWPQKPLGTYRNRGKQDLKVPEMPLVAESPASPDNGTRPGTQESLFRPHTQQGPQYIMRKVGVGVVNVKLMLEQRKSIEQTVSVWGPAENSLEAQEIVNQTDQLVRDLLSNQSGQFTKCKSIDHICLGLHSFASPEASALIYNTPTLLQNIAQTPKIGFSGAPTKPRSDIYLTLSEAFLPVQALLSHPERGTVPISPNMELRNVQLTLQICRKSGERIENCIFPHSNSLGQTSWRTSATERGEAWNQVVKLVIPTDDVPEAHLMMSLADAPGFPFALSWMPLWDQEAFIRDGPHTPLLYLYDKLTSSADKGRGAYLAFPWSSRGKDDTSKDETLTGPVATVKLETYLCSTVFSQDKVLLGILKWREQPAGQLLDLLRRFVFVSEIEIVKLINNVFDSLFSILIEHAGKDEYEDLIFNALVTVLGIVHDRRFNLGPLVDQYAETKFDYPFATPCLIRSYRRLLAKPSDPQNSRRLRATFKVGRGILKFIINAREKQKVKEAGIGITTTQPAFNRDLNSIFAALEALMKDPAGILIGSKTLIVQHLHNWLPELTSSLPVDEIVKIAFNFLDACVDVQGKLILYKLVLILNLSKMVIFSKGSIRQQIITGTAKWIDPYWGLNAEISDQWREQVRLCCSIVSLHLENTMLEMPGYFIKIIQSFRSIQGAGRAAKNHLTLLFPTTYPFPSKPISSTSEFDEALSELAALLAQLSGKSFADSFDHPNSDLENILSTALQVNMSILSGDAFPNSWLSLHVYHHKSSLQLLESLYEIIITNFLPFPEDADDFNTELWSNFFLTLLTLLKSSTLALETFPEQKRRAVWKIAGDVREQGAVLLRRSWEAIGWESSPDDQDRYGVVRLGGFQVQYVPKLVAPIVELCLSVHEGLRGVAVAILQTMVVSEWTLSEDLSVIQAEMIECLDLMFKSKNVGEGITHKLFLNELLDLFEPLSCNPEDTLWQAVNSLVSTVDELLELLGAVHSNDTTEAFRILHTLQLMEFLKDMQKEDIFIRYVHQLAQIQARLHNTTEAALALRLHAELYTWDSRKVGPLGDPAFPEQTSFERKEQLYFEMIKHYEEGAAWDCALGSYRELANQYEHHHYDFAKLARTQRSMAKIFETIAKGERSAPRYFRVVYAGLGFPSSLRDKQFIFEALSSERISVFTDRMRQQHPSAQIAPSGEIDNLEGQFLQIFPVSPHRDVAHPLYQQSRVAQSVREYILSSQPNRFAVTTKRHSPASGVQDQWIEKTIYTTTNSFPTILRRCQIVAVDVVSLSPLQTAIERTTRKTAELATLEKRVADGDELALTSLSDAIDASVDPLSASSIAQYRKLIPVTKQSQEDGEEPEEAPVGPLQNALQLAMLDHASALKHCLSLYLRPAHLNTQDALSQRLQMTFAPELSLLDPHPRPTSPLRFQLPSSPPLSPSQMFPSTTPTRPSLSNGNYTSEPLIPQAPPSTDPRSRSRLSLSFLKTPHKANGVSSAPSSTGDETASNVSHRSDGVVDSEDGSVTKNTGTENGERPTTAHSGRSGSMRKRLSLLGIRKAGKGSMKKGGTGVGKVDEE